MSSTFDRPSSSSEDEFFDAYTGDEEVKTERKSIDDKSIKEVEPSTSETEVFVQPKAPPRKKKVNILKKGNSFNENSLPFKDHLKIDNLANYVDDIASIQGDLSVTDAYVSNSDRKSVHVDDLKRKDLSDDLINRLVEENRLKDTQSNSRTAKDSQVTKNLFQKTEESKTIINETIKEDEESVHCINPINLHLLKITNDDYDSDDEDTAEDDERSSQVTERISDNLESVENQDDVTLKKEALKKTVKNFGKKIGEGLKKSVQKVKNSASASSNLVSRSEQLTDRFDSPQPTDPQQNQVKFKYKSNRKKEPADFDGMKIIQELNECNGAIWCMKWSLCGRLLAVAGKDQLLRVYCCSSAWKYFTQMRLNASSGVANQISPNSTSSNKERSFSGSRNSISSMEKSYVNQSFDSFLQSSSSKFATDDNVLSEEGPLLLFSAYNGHKADCLDIAWSKNHFLLSSSMDKTVLLWHVSRVECLCIFRHIDFVTTIQFHPRDDRYFLSGSLDGKVRLWNIPDKRVTLWNEVNALPVANRNKNQNSTVPNYGLITASAFVQNGKFAVIGTYDGRVIFYTTDQFKYFTQLHIGSEKQQPITRLTDTTSTDRRKAKQNFKITGIEGLDENKILVTTNDSRIRLYDLRDLSLACKYKGHTNISSQIRASVSHDNRFIICGSENSSFYIWKLIQENTLIGQRRDRNSQWESVRILPNNNSLFSMHNNNPNSATSGSKNSPGIITAATFATMPSILDQKAKYVIAIADFNGCIRLFAKYHDE